MKTSGKIWIFFDSTKAKQTKPMSTTQAQMLVLSLQNRDLSRYSVWTPGWDEWIPLTLFLQSEQNIFVVAPVPTPAKPTKNNDKENSKGEKTFADFKPEEIDEITKTISGAIEEDSDFTVVALENTSGGQKQDYGYYFQDFNASELKLPNVSLKPPNKKTSQGKAHKADSKQEGQDRRTADRHQFKIEIILVSKSGRSLRTHSKNISLSGTLLEDELPKEFRTGDLDMVIVNKFDRDLKHGRLHFKGKVVGDLSNPKRLSFIDPEPEMIARLDALLRSYINHSKFAKKKSA